MSAVLTWRPSRKRLALASGSVLAVFALAAVLAPLIAPFLPDAIDLAQRRAAPSAHHWFGTDDLGRDLLSRILYGGRVSLAIGVLAALLSSGLGVAIGIAAAWWGGWIDDVLMRVTDAMLVVPRLPLLMIAAAIFTPGVPGLIILVGVAGWMETARVIRAEALTLRGRPFIEAATALGAREWHVMLRHLLPNAAPAAAVAVTLAVGRAILLESALSFFGVGVQPPTASWGNMLYQAQGAMTTEPWLALFPGSAIFLTVLCVNVLGDDLAAVRR
jgi:peptide/nickel transport system permease protein